jgi:hypothetical protein
MAHALACRLGIAPAVDAVNRPLMRIDFIHHLLYLNGSVAQCAAPITRLR